MAVALFVFFVVLPIVELFVLIQVASWIGALPAIALVLLVSFAGLWLVKREGLSVARKVQTKLAQGEAPATDMVNGMLILAAGVLMVFPGFVTAIAGLLLLLPPTRAVVRTLLMRRFESRLAATLAAPGGTAFRSGFSGGGTRRVFTGSATYGGVVDVREVDDDRSSADPSANRTTDPPQLGRY